MQESSSSLKKKVKPIESIEYFLPVKIDNKIYFSGHDFCEITGLSYSRLGDLMNTENPLTRIESIRHAGKAYIPVEEVQKYFIRQGFRAAKLMGVFNDTTTASSGNSVSEIQGQQ